MFCFIWKEIDKENYLYLKNINDLIIASSKDNMDEAYKITKKNIDDYLNKNSDNKVSEDEALLLGSEFLKE